MVWIIAPIGALLPAAAAYPDMAGTAAEVLVAATPGVEMVAAPMAKLVAKYSKRYMIPPWINRLSSTPRLMSLSGLIASDPSAVTDSKPTSSRMAMVDW